MNNNNNNKYPGFQTASGKQWPTAGATKDVDLAAILEKLDALATDVEDLCEMVAEHLGLVGTEGTYSRKSYMQIDTLKNLRVRVYKLYYLLKFYS